MVCVEKGLENKLSFANITERNAEKVHLTSMPLKKSIFKPYMARHRWNIDSLVKSVVLNGTEL